MKILLVFLAISANIIAQVQINEVCPDNDELLSSKDGKYYDWIELYNHSNESINLSEYSLSDDKDDLNAWNFGNVNIEAKSFLIIYASGIDEPTSQGELHTNFKLSSEGETLYLAKSGVMVDSIKFGNVYEDYTYGRLEENSEIKCHLATPTPSSSNKNSGTIIASRESGFYVSEFDLKLTAAEGLSIYYTTNGDDPTINSKKYNGNIVIKDEYEEYEYLNVPTTPPDSFKCRSYWNKLENPIPRLNVISYRVLKSDNKLGNIYRKSYKLAQNHTMPIFSIITDNKNLFDNKIGIYVPGEFFNVNNPCWSGNYFARGKNWERDASASYFEGKELYFDENIGIRIHGGGSRNAVQKPIKFYARKEYGINKFENEFFPQLNDLKFNNLLLRSTVNDWFGILIKDAVTMEAVRNLNFEQTYVKPVVGYINGNYWGIHELRNRIDESYLAEKYNISEESINIIHPSNPVILKHGTYEDFKPYYDLIANEDLTVEENYLKIAEKIELTSLIDYYIAEMFFINTDWPSNNYMIWNSSELDGKYRPIFYDLDAGWGNPYYDMFEHCTQDTHSNWPNAKEINVLFIKLMQNETFKTQFINRAVYLIDNEFTQERLKGIVSQYVDIYEPEIDENINRFGFPESKEVWYSEIQNRLIHFAHNRGCQFKLHMANMYEPDADFLCNPLSVEDDSSIQLSLLPNPAESYISINNINSEFVELYSFSGVLLLRIDTKYKTDTNLDISKYPSGVYFIKTQNTMSKFIKIK